MKKLAKSKGVMMEEPEYFGERCFREEASRRFPELATELEAETGIHIQMAMVALSARTAIESGDLPFLCRVFTFLEDVLSRPRVSPEIENAVAISFLLRADFDASPIGNEAWELLPQKLKDVLQAAI